MRTVGELRAALAAFPDAMPVVMSDDSSGDFNSDGLILRLVAFSAEWQAVKFLDEPNPPLSGPEKGEELGWGPDCEADRIDALYVYSDAPDGDVT
jgi:hypothetical protein